MLSHDEQNETSLWDFLIFRSLCRVGKKREKDKRAIDSNKVCVNCLNWKSKIKGSLNTCCCFNFCAVSNFCLGSLRQEALSLGLSLQHLYCMTLGALLSLGLLCCLRRVSGRAVENDSEKQDSSIAILLCFFRNIKRQFWELLLCEPFYRALQSR